MSDSYIYYTDEILEERVKEISILLKLPTTEMIPSAYRYLLYVKRTGIELKDADGRSLSLDLDQNKVDYFRKIRSPKKELLSKALGEKARQGKVIDLSCGLGIDSVFMCQLGYQVIAVERNSLIYFLLHEALGRTDRPELSQMSLYCEEAISFLKNNRGALLDQVKAIYFDPMYPQSKKSALPRQEMVLFRNLVGNDTDATEVIKEAMTWPSVRVVVKRPLDAEPLWPNRVHAYKGKSVRFDMYLGSSGVK